MPGNVRYDWHARVRAVEQEYGYVRAGVGQLADAVARGQVRLSKDQSRARRDATDNLEATYLVRLYAVFEAALRSYWTAEVRESRPPAEVLIDQVASRRDIPQSEIEDVHAVRLARNALVHDNAVLTATVTLTDARGRLQAYIKRLPDEW